MAVDYFLKIDGIDGEATDAKFKNAIDVLSFSWGASNAHSGFGGGVGAGKVNMQDFSFTMPYSKASPALMQACATGQHIKSAVLTARKAGKEQQEYLKMTFTEVFVSSYQIGASSEIPMDSISLNFSKVEVAYSQQGVDGKVSTPIKVGYDLKLNSKV
jgi:type VI secretion system secreted protein Hcp